jgi:RNA polymerase sigma-70 factor (ECF subfamily)
MMAASQLQRAPPKVPPLHELVADTSADLYRLALRLTGDEHEAEDVLQGAYITAFESLRRGAFRGECALTTWLYRIVVHAAFDARRTAKRRERLVDPPSRPADARADSALELRELRDALESLPEDQRAALALKELHGLKGREVAEVMERSEGSVEQLLVRARASLRERLER